jgi:DNA-binding protein HU-alpha
MKEQTMGSTPTKSTAKPAGKADMKVVPKTDSAGGKAASTVAAKPKMAVLSPVPMVVSDNRPVVAGPMLKKKDFVDRVTERSGVKKKDAKPAIEAALALLGEALIAGEELNLPPLGKIKVNRAKDVSGGIMLMVKLRIPNEPGVSSATDDNADDSAPLADKDDDS